MIEFTVSIFDRYVGGMDKDAAQRRLELMPDGTFLVRTNVTDRGFRIAIKLVWQKFNVKYLVSY